MSVLDDLKRLSETFPPGSPDPEGLARLREFLERMKREGIARTRDYELPQVDTIGRSVPDGWKRRAG